MPHSSPADELAAVRAEILRLRAKEFVLRKQILKDPDVNSIGRWHRIEIDEHRDLVLDISRLPEQILQDRNFWREKIVKTLRCLPLQSQTNTRPGWPIRRELDKVLH